MNVFTTTTTSSTTTTTTTTTRMIHNNGLVHDMQSSWTLGTCDDSLRFKAVEIVVSYRIAM